MIAEIIIVIAMSGLAMLLFPVTFYVDSVRSGGKLDGTFSISWIIFMFRYALRNGQMEILVFGRRIIRHIHKEIPIKPKVTKKVRRIKKFRKIPPVREIFSLVGPFLRLFKEVIYAIRLKYLDIHVNFGFDDPAYTGIVTGFLHAVRSSLRVENNVRWTVDFTRQVLDWNVKAKAAIIPIQILPPVARFIASRRVLNSGLRIIRF